eukprot:8249542-Karenia_brevis.AAC.1
MAVASSCFTVAGDHCGLPIAFRDKPSMTLMCAVAIFALILHPTNVGPVFVPGLTVPPITPCTGWKLARLQCVLLTAMTS